MPADEQFDQRLALPQPASKLGQAVLDDCRAARIGDVTEFAECLVKTRASCSHGFVFNAFRYCVHPQREKIMARTLAAEPPPAK
jgi:hypothetical protein